MVYIKELFYLSISNLYTNFLGNDRKPRGRGSHFKRVVGTPYEIPWKKHLNFDKISNFLGNFFNFSSIKDFIRIINFTRTIWQILY